jgi:hypothetical protein
MWFSAGAELQGGHPGPQLALDQAGGAVDWWLRWSATERALVELDAETGYCETTGPPIDRTLAEALTEIVISLDLSDDDAITPKAVMEVLEPVIALLQDLPEQDRQALAELINQCAQEETRP